MRVSVTTPCVRALMNDETGHVIAARQGSLSLGFWTRPRHSMQRPQFEAKSLGRCGMADKHSSFRDNYPHAYRQN